VWVCTRRAVAEHFAAEVPQPEQAARVGA
jgi:hypothetical protein